MDSVKSSKKPCMIVAVIIPLCIANLFAVTGKLVVFLAYLASLLLVTAVIPGFHSRENGSMFALLAISSIPANLYMIIYLLKTDFMTSMSEGVKIIGVLWGILLYALLFSLEQICIGILVRILWPNQLSLDEEQGKLMNNRRSVENNGHNG